MRLKKLTLQAFGPFKDNVVIDFEDDKIDKGLLLISGDTGSGKTTIFDAICFALYGKTSGETRKIDSLRSDWASPEVETFVELEFYYKNKFYEVRRSPSYSRKRNNAQKETKKPATAEFNIDGRIVTKTKDVTKEVEQLIGLDYKQFSQVAMLSQGEFTKFLLAKSDDKTTIFRKIFGTEFYERFENELKARKSSKENELKFVKEKIKTEKINIKPIIDVCSLSNDELIPALTDKINEGADEVLKTKEERDKKGEEKTKLSNELENLNELNKDILNYQEASEKLESLLASNPNIEEEKEKYDYNVMIANSITLVLKSLNDDSELLETKKKDCIKNKKCLETKMEEYEEKKEIFKNLDNYPQDAEKLNNEINDLINKDKHYDTILSKMNELNDAQNECRVKSDLCEKKNKLFENMRREYYLNVSVEMAETLIEGEPCPVCGSKEHPKKAVAAECNFTKEDLDNAENELKSINSERKTIEGRIDEIRKIIDEYDIPEDFDVDLERKTNNELLETRKKAKENLDNEFKELSDEKEKLVSDIKRYENNIEIFSKDIKNLEENIRNNNAELSKLYKENNTDYDDYISKKLDEKDLFDLKTKIESFDNDKTNFNSTIELLEEKVKDKEIVDVSQKEEELNSINEEYEKLDGIHTDLNSTLEKLKSSTDNIKDYITDYDKIQGEFDIIKVLSDTANGSLRGKQKISFENYVQSYFMKSVLVEANKRFIKMTESRFELKRKEVDIQKSSKSGLEFSIFDSYTGKERDVSSLSGGEKFKASLALALGMSDVISNNRGGIKIDSLFIDEGFGSLDSDSLNQALNILYDLSGNDKLIGVISHVSELKSRIDNKILINKTYSGSEIDIEANN